MRKGRKNVIILGSTGSIGRNALDVLSKHQDKFKVIALAAGSDEKLLARQINKIIPDIAVIADKSKYKKLKNKVRNKKTKILSGSEAVIDIAGEEKADLVVVAISGADALKPLLAAIENKKDIALANKESLVMAGSIIMSKAKERKVKIIPVDSEHSAIFQCLHNKPKDELKKIYLTGSGGALDKVPKVKLSQVLPDEALSHPKWKMGQKITVDSATLMNKGLEVIEAMHLFEIAASNIEVLIHPEAIIHSMVEFIDGSILAQMAVTDMRIPIQYALSYPARFPSKHLRLDFSKIAHLTFKKPDFSKFPSLKLCFLAAEKGATFPAALGAADEVLVGAYLSGKIRLTDIPKIIKKVLLQHKPVKDPELTDILRVDAQVRQLTEELIEKIKR
jgi:1-deoxy-D-xylulose-5-phosphate reductoisomerase